MFTIEKYYENHACLRDKQILLDILHSSGVSQIWLNTNHVFLVTKTSKELYVFDVLPEVNFNERTASRQDHVIDTNNEHTVQVIWNKQEPSLIYIITASGSLSFWKFLKPSYKWVKQEYFQLSNAKGATIIDVQFHEDTGNIVWCEKRGLGEATYCVCCRNLRRQLKDEQYKNELGPTQAVLHNCPLIEILSFNDGICIHPIQDHLKKFYIFWSGRNDVKAVVFKNGHVDDSVTCGPDFCDIAITLIASWARIPDDDDHTSLVGMTIHPTTQDLITLNHNGVVSRITFKCNTVKCYPLITIKENILEKHMKIFTNNTWFGVINEANMVFLYDFTSGKRLFEIKDFSCETSGKLSVHSSYSGIPITVLWTQDNVWKLEWSLKEVDYVKDSVTVTDVAEWWSKYGSKHKAGLMLLDNIISSNNNSNIDTLRKLSEDIFQNPATMLAMCDGQESLEILQQYLEELDHAHPPSTIITPLNTRTRHIFEDIRYLNTCLKHIPSLDLNNMLTRLGEGQMCLDMNHGLDTVISGTPDTHFLDQLEILSLHHQQYLAQLFSNVVKDYTEVGGEMNKIEKILRDELSERRWKRKRNPDNASVLATLVQVLYKNHPEILLDVLKMAKTFVNQSQNESMLKEIEDCVCDFILEIIPNMWTEKQDVKQIKYHIKLLLSLNLQTHAMELLLHSCQWKMALDIYIEITQQIKDEQMVSQLYQMLLSGVLRNCGNSELPLLADLLQLKPTNMDVCDIYEICLTNMPNKCTQMIFNNHVLTVAKAKKALGKYLPQ